MSHFLKRGELRGARALHKPRAAVKVQAKSAGLWLQPGIVVARADALFVELPSRIQVVDLEGEVIEPSDGERFLVSTETIDPFHLVVQVPR